MNKTEKERFLLKYKSICTENIVADKLFCIIIKLSCLKLIRSTKSNKYNHYQASVSQQLFDHLNKLFAQILFEQSGTSFASTSLYNELLCNEVLNSCIVHDHYLDKLRLLSALDKNLQDTFSRSLNILDENYALKSDDYNELFKNEELLSKISIILRFQTIVNKLSYIWIHRENGHTVECWCKNNCFSTYIPQDVCKKCTLEQKKVEIDITEFNNSKFVKKYNCDPYKGAELMEKVKNQVYLNNWNELKPFLKVLEKLSKKKLYFIDNEFKEIESCKRIIYMNAENENIHKYKGEKIVIVTSI